MQIKFSHKVFLLLLLNGIVIVGCMVLAAKYYSGRNFENYVDKVELERLGELASALAREFDQDLGWGPMLAEMGGRLGMGMGGGFGYGAGRGHGMNRDGHGPSHRNDPGQESRGSRGGPAGLPEAGQARGRRGPSRDAEMGMGRRAVTLFDADRKPLTLGGPSADEAGSLQPIEVDGRVVGWVGSRRPGRAPENPLDAEFLRVQAQTIYTTGAIAFLLTLVLTWLLSRQLLAPVRELARGTRSLKSRRFDTRVEVRSNDELGQLASDFNDMAGALERYEESRRQWMADISHELRTPLSILRGEIEAMQDGVRGSTPEALESLHAEVHHVGRIVDDLRDLSMLESPGFDVRQEPVELLGSLAEAVQCFQARLERRGIRVETDFPPPVSVAGLTAERLMKNGRVAKPGGAGAAEDPASTGEVIVLADSDRLKQLFSNILQNVLRYVESPGTLKISHDIKSDWQVLLLFEDSGPGVPPDALPRLFDRLYRVDRARSRAQGGSGLGLAICRGIVERFGGRIEASAAPAGGLLITVALPLFR